MDTNTYPGNGLSLSQLVFALSEELKHTAYSPSFTLDEVLELNQDASTASTTIREWMNSLVPINRFPLNVLSLIPTHLSSQNDRFRATFVCRRWRRTFLQHVGLWSPLYLSKGEAYVKTLLERARGSPLTILAHCMDPIGTITLLPPYTKQIRGLEFENNHWADIQRFSEINSGPLPLLRTLDINVPQGQDVVTPPSHPLFSSATGLKEFSLHSEGSTFLSNFVFPNLTSFELSVDSGEQFLGSQLLDFLEASPVLQVVHMRIITALSLEDVPRERIVVLHNIKNLCLIANDLEPGYRLATHILCPSVEHTLLTHTLGRGLYLSAPLKYFPDSPSWNETILQYTRGPIEELALDIKTDSNHLIACSLTFRSANTTDIGFRFEITEDNGRSSIPERQELFMPIHYNSFFKASREIRDLPLLANIKRFHVYGPLYLDKKWTVDIAKELRQLFRSLGPLEELRICRCNMIPFLFAFYTDRCGFGPMVYPPIKALTISYPLNIPSMEFVGALMSLAKSQLELGRPFERVTVRMHDPPAGTEETLKLWVSVVDFYAG